MKTHSLFCLTLILLTGCTKETPLVNKQDVTFEARTNSKVKTPADLNEVEILPSNSDFNNEIWLVSPVVFLIGIDDHLGSIVELPPVTKNVELIFEIRPYYDEAPTGDGPWQTGPCVRNPDGQKTC